MKILISGGHITPAIAVINEIKIRHADWSIVFVGRMCATEDRTAVSEEYRLITASGIPFISLTAGRVRRFLSFRTVTSFMKIPVGFFQALMIVLKEKPSCIVSFGGYIGLPCVAAGWVCHIPTIIHEQTNVPGLANRLAAFFATKICIRDSSVQRYFAKSRTVITGLPMRPEIDTPPKDISFQVTSGRKIIYITGGATGSLSINICIYPIVAKLVGKYTIVHQVGRSWIRVAGKIRQSLRGNKRKYYIIAPYVDAADHAWLLSHATLLLSRAGANTVEEVQTVGMPALFIPLPWSAGNEQYENAKPLADAGGAMILNQKDMTPQKLLETINLMVDNIAGYKAHAQKKIRSVHRNASEEMVAVIASVIKE